MENAQNMNSLGIENCLAMVPFDHNHEKSINDIMNRRLKNRERQRRYRARKRLEADRKKSSSINNSAPLPMEMQIDGIPDNCVTRVYCRRNWKKNARMAHALKEQEGTFNGPVCSGLTSHDQDNGERRAIPGRRRWKVDARNKKNLC